MPETEQFKLDLQGDEGRYQRLGKDRATSDGEDNPGDLAWPSDTGTEP